MRLESLPGPCGPNRDWQRLGLASQNPFVTLEWAAAWWRHFGRDRPLHILGFRDDSGTLIGLLPLYLASRRPVRVLRFIGHGPANQLGPVCAPEHRVVAAAALKQALSELDWNVYIGERMAVAEGWHDLLGGVVTRLESSPTIRFESADWDHYLSTRSANFRQQARRFERRLDRKYELRFRVADDQRRIEDDMDTFFALHDARWAREGGSSSFAGPLRDFHREIGALALAGGWLRLWFLELDGVPRAATYNFQLGHASWFFQSGRDPEFNNDRLGQVLLNHTIRQALREGIDEFKLLIGEHGYKDRYATGDAPVETIALARGVASRAALKTIIPARNAFRAAGQRLQDTKTHTS